MTYGIIGTGAIGGFYGAKLAHSAQPVHFLLHKDYDHVREHGLQVDSCDGSFHLPSPLIYHRTADMPPCDVVLVGLKTTNNHLLKTLLKPLLKPDTLVVLIQNGIGVERDVEAMWPDVSLAAGLAFICSAKTEPGHVSHLCYGQINLGGYNVANDDARLLQVVADLRAAGITTGLVDYEEARWKKAVWNMPFNGMTVALHAQTDALLQHPSTRQLIREQMREVIRAAHALGVSRIDEHFADQMVAMTDQMIPYSPSMRLDYDFGRPMELHYLYEVPLAMARQAGAPMFKLEMLLSELQFLSSINKGI